MKNDLISREAVVDLVNNVREFYQSETKVSVVPISHILEMLETIPTVAAAPEPPTPTMEDFIDDERREECSQNGHLEVEGLRMNFCGHCGTRMKDHYITRPPSGIYDEIVRAEPPTDGDRQISLKAIMELVGRRQGELLTSTLATRRGRWLELGKLLVDLESLGAAAPPSAPAPRPIVICRDEEDIDDHRPHDRNDNCMGWSPL
jgi:hypothetical protein